MNIQTYKQIEAYMQLCMKDSAHDTQHVYRVLHIALQIAKDEQNVDYDVLISACLLHDIARLQQHEKSVCHALEGASRAFVFLLKHGHTPQFCERVSACIAQHRFRTACKPSSIESKILFDADKVDVCGVIGVARTLLYMGKENAPLYDNGKKDAKGTYFHEYKKKLQKIHKIMYTKKGKELAKQRRKHAKQFHKALCEEIKQSQDATCFERFNLLAK